MQKLLLSKWLGRVPSIQWKHGYAVLFFALLTIGIAVRVSYLNGTDFSKADETVYLRYARYIGRHGLGGFRDLTERYVRTEALWIFPNPLRIGYIALSAWSMKATRIYDFEALVYLSSVFSIGLLGVAYAFARRVFGRDTALLLLGLMSCAPLDLAMARRALQESCFHFFSVASIWLFYEMVHEADTPHPKVRGWSYVFAAAYAFCILVKETAWLFYIFFVAYLLVQRYVLKKEIPWGRVVPALLVPVGIVGSAYLGLMGGMARLLAVVKIILSSPGTNPYALAYQSGPWFGYLVDYLVLSPWVLILAVGFLVGVLAERTFEADRVYVALFIGVTLATFSFFTKNVRYVIMLDVPLRLSACLMMQRVLPWRDSRRGFLLAMAAVSAIAVSDFWTFRTFFIQEGIYDPVTFWLLRARHIIPWK